MLFGDAEVLVAAKDLVNGRSVRRCADGPVDYVQLVLDAMQVIYVQGVPTECPVFSAANQLQAHSQAVRRRALHPFEARILMTAAA
jgi:Hint domain